jgi:hypothetical protein
MATAVSLASRAVTTEREGLTPAEVAVLYGKSTRTIYRWIALGRVDAFRDPGGAGIFIPFESLRAETERMRPHQEV